MKTRVSRAWALVAWLCLVAWASEAGERTRGEGVRPSEGPGVEAAGKAGVEGAVRARPPGVPRGVAKGTGARAGAKAGAGLGLEAAAGLGRQTHGPASEALGEFAEALAAGGQVVVEHFAEREAEAQRGKWLEHEAEAEGNRYTESEVAWLRNNLPRVDTPPKGLQPEEDWLWEEYVAYVEDRLGELAGTVQWPEDMNGPKLPLKWEGYRRFRFRFEQARKYQRGVTNTLMKEVKLPEEERDWLKGMEAPLVFDNLGLRGERRKKLGFADQSALDRASLKPGRRPWLVTFSCKQRDFSRMSEGDIRKQVKEDVLEALSKYGHIVEVRRPPHPLFGQKVAVTTVYLVYDGTGLTEQIKNVILDTVGDQDIRVRFHGR